MADPTATGVTRRWLLAAAFGTPVAAALAGHGAAQTAAAASCLDIDALPAAQKSLRRSLGFQLRSPDLKKQCAGCQFFKATAAGCGTCQLLSGGAVTATSVCDSWAAKA